MPGVCLAVGLIRKGEPAQQQVRLQAFVANRFGSDYRQRQPVESIGSGRVPGAGPGMSLRRG